MNKPQALLRVMLRLTLFRQEAACFSLLVRLCLLKKIDLTLNQCVLVVLSLTSERVAHA